MKSNLFKGFPKKIVRKGTKSEGYGSRVFRISRTKKIYIQGSVLCHRWLDTHTYYMDRAPSWFGKGEDGICFLITLLPLSLNGYELFQGVRNSDPADLCKAGIWPTQSDGMLYCQHR